MINRIPPYQSFLTFVLCGLVVFATGCSTVTFFVNAPWSEVMLGVMNGQLLEI